MTVTFYSNFLNHLQTPFCDEMYKILGAKFVFVSTQPMAPERIFSGYQDCSNYVYNLNSYADKSQYEKALKLGLYSDIVIIGGGAPLVFVNERLKLKKHTFMYSERLLKRGWWLLFHPGFLMHIINKHILQSNKNVYMLCASAYTASDLRYFFAYPKRKYKWGYFTAFHNENIQDIIKNKPDNVIKIIWVARFLTWKHPELIIKLALKLKEKNYQFHIDMIGEGENKKDIQFLIEECGLKDHVTLIGSVANSIVSDKMKKSNIFLFTSDRNEGWGVVLNEAMSNGCAIVASDMIGAVPYLIENEVNGLVFKSNDLESLTVLTEKLIVSKEFREKLSENAYVSIKETWNPVNAAQNFIRLAISKVKQEDLNIAEGPCSPA